MINQNKIAEVINDEKFRTAYERERCRRSFFYFVQAFWDVIIKEKPIYNWHIEYLCGELQELSKSIVKREKKPYDIIINIPPGTTKSTITTIMYPTWLWTQDPSIRIITNSYSMNLSIEHATKSRDIVLSDKFRLLFPEVQIRRDKSQKTSYENTLTGARYTTSTGGTITGKHAHCLPAGTMISTPTGLKKIEEIVVNEMVISEIFGTLASNKVTAKLKRKNHELFEITTKNGHVRATAEHPFFVLGQGYTTAENLQKGDRLLRIEEVKNLPDLQPMPCKTSSFNRISDKIISIKRVNEPGADVYDLEVEIAHNFFANGYLVHNCIINDDPLNPGQSMSAAEIHGANEHTKTLSTRKVDKENTPTLTIMQRLHENDVTGYLLAKKGESIKHINLPAEVSDKVRPAELKEKYIGGKLDPIRLSQSVLDEARIDLGSLAYAGQYEQEPQEEGGNIVKADWFKTITAQDFDKMKGDQKYPITFFADTAYTSQAWNDPTGVIATCKLGNDLYITHARKVNMKFPDLIRFLPEYCIENGYTNESTIRIEPKANGLSVIDQLQETTKLNITKTPTPTEDKETRLNSASPSIECGRVILVAGQWNEEFISEICGFPNKTHDEYVDLICYATQYHLKQEAKKIDLSSIYRNLY